MESFLVISLIALFIRTIFLSRRIRETQDRLNSINAGSDQAISLTQRVYSLEQLVKTLQPTETPAAPPVVAEKPAPPVLAEKPASQPGPAPIADALNLCQWCGRKLPPPPAVCKCREAEEPSRLPKVEPPPLPKLEPAFALKPEPLPPAPPELPREAQPEPSKPESTPEQIPVPVFSMASPEPAGPRVPQRLRDSLQGAEWEAMVGGNWLNKLGVFLVVVGVATFLGYEFAHVGPLGRAAIGLGVSLSMLIGGFLLEKRALYRTFGRGLLGGGWASLYFTVYAMQAVPETKLIDDPIAGGLLLLSVAAGMIIHSLRYKSQTVTGLAYFIAFVTLAITPVTALSVVALIPLAASLLVIAARFNWSQMALFGLIATYGTCISRGDSGAPPWSAEIIFLSYWLLFEGFDLVRASRRNEYTAWESAIFPFNALAFGALSFVKWSKASPDHLYGIAAGIAALYLLSAVARARLRPPSSFAADTGTLERAMSGGYEGPVTLTAALTVAAILLKMHGATAQFSLLAEAELFFLAGLLFREAYPRYLAAALFTGGLGKLLVMDIPAGGTTGFDTWPFQFQAWTPVTACNALLFYVNRMLRRADLFYGYAGSALVALILGFEMPQRYIGLAWFALAIVLFALGWFRGLRDFRIQGYCTAALGLGGTSVHQINIATGAAPPLRYPWLSLAGAATFSYAAVLTALRSGEARMEEWERTGLRRVGSWAASIVLVALLWRVLPGAALGIGWIALALPLLELGLARLPEDFRVQSYVVFALGALRLFAFNLIPIANNEPVEKRWIIAAGAALAYLFAARIHIARPRLAEVAGRVFDAVTAAGTLFLLASLWQVLPGIAVGPAWAVVALLLMELGYALDLPGLRLQAHVSFAASFGRLFVANFTGLGHVGILTHRVLTVAPVVAAHYYQWLRMGDDRVKLRAWELTLRRAYLYTAVILAATLVRFELGRVLAVMGWAALAVAVLFAGRRLNNIDLRWQSYALAALTFWRSWTTNFYAPESFGGVSGRILTGAFVIACLYTAQLLSARGEKQGPGIEARARAYFSLLASVLLAVLLYYEVSGSMLTVAWGIEGVALLVTGFPLTDRVLRLSGLALFLVCILKLFAYDMRHLETMYRIVSFIVLGLMLVSVSWIYTRFRDRIQRYL